MCERLQIAIDSVQLGSGNNKASFGKRNVNLRVKVFSHYKTKETSAKQLEKEVSSRTPSLTFCRYLNVVSKEKRAKRALSGTF